MPFENALYVGKFKISSMFSVILIAGALIELQNATEQIIHQGPMRFKFQTRRRDNTV